MTSSIRAGHYNHLTTTTLKQLGVNSFCPWLSLLLLLSLLLPEAAQLRLVFFYLSVQAPISFFPTTVYAGE